MTKKNSQQIYRNSKTGKPFISQSDRYKDYEEACKYILKPLRISHKVNIKAVYYMKTRRKVDLVNLHSALHDVLVACKVLEDDNFKIIHSTDGSYVDYDKDNPRTEVEISKV